MKECFKCGLVKPLSEYYKHKKMADGHLNKCKECAKADVKKNRAENVDYYREYDKFRYSNEGVRKSERNAYTKKYRKENPEKYAAHSLLGYAVKSGRIVKPSDCPKCGEFTPSRQMHAHHDDYAKPLEVRWMCVRCHAKEHPREEWY